MFSFAGLLQYALSIFRTSAGRGAEAERLRRGSTSDSRRARADLASADGFVFDSNDMIGSGGYGRIFRGKHLRRDAAIKLNESRESFARECAALARVQPHECVVELLGVEREQMWIALELATGDLFTLVSEVTRVEEAHARDLFRQMLSALGHLHGRDVAHRDVKLENWLTFPHRRIKLADFGLAHVYAQEERNRSISGFVGSTSYCAPELFSRSYCYDGFLLDSWSVTVCLFAMVTGFFPFDEASHNDWRYTRVYMRGKDENVATVIFALYNRPCTLSASLCDLIDCVFGSRACVRPLIASLRSHPWPDERAEGGEVVLDGPRLWRSCQLSVQKGGRNEHDEHDEHGEHGEHCNDGTPRLCRMSAATRRSPHSM